MKVFLAATYTREWLLNKKTPKYVLESFWYVKDWQVRKIKEWDMFLLDSGAFTFMNANGGAVDFNDYLSRYIDFINDNNIRYFFELDIDSVVGYDRVKQMTRRLERETGRRCIPVWHKSRGLDEWRRLTSEYDYAAIGGIVTKEIKKQEYPYFTKLLQIAHKNGCKVHGLGFTYTELLHTYHFDSVDSTSWLSASRFAQIQYFDGRQMRQRKKPENKKMVHFKQVDDFVFGEWIKFQEYADKNL